MSRPYLRSTIIVLTQTLLPIVALLLIGPCLLQSQVIKQWQHQLSQLKPWFMALHVLFYLALIFVWPKIIKNLRSQNPLSDAQLNTAQAMRWYLLAVFLLIDALVLWSKS